ncbi:hypothetical protein T02_3436 [Trichinella nativa]|uniref:Uncharacterized protein n=1 Tax=Trichinella nativa TaxID=6335 RepID=A0A0V1L7Y4_9BILA|nr:hypothetical protein T02_3436 [Trichinella nativa]
MSLYKNAILNACSTGSADKITETCLRLICNRKPYYSTPIAHTGRLAGAFSRPLLARELASPTMTDTLFGIWRLCRSEKRREIALQRRWMRRI